ncbi:uncharacterized protein LOC128889210 [Hylaeus anthracinus]|uniref:uncharacterized protein LOC128875237 n=1 Tax=Hylaeus volcanicus TaxID=313075 RepID=UPI0023B79DAA|nr:uncharacterized protein LOC128875237 [Hylaeus volcanicus]XP_054002632.1 uncharacterized protein LOC128889210 [Hylaeus anthracinus]
MRHFGHRYVYLAFLLASASARSADTSPTINSIDEQSARSSSSNVFADLRQVYQIYKECADQELSPCLKMRLLSAVDRMYRSIQLNVADGVTFIRDDPAIAEEDPVKSLQEIEASLPRALDDKEDALNNMIYDKIVKFFQSHTLKLKLPNVEELQRSLVEEGRKKKKNMGLLAIPLLIGGTLVPLALGALALLAGKALIVSKLALVLASIIGLKKLVSGGGDHGHEVVQVASGGHGSSGWARSSHDLAYSAYKPSST